MDWTTEINQGGFGEMSEMRWVTVKSWTSFLEFFEDARIIESVTYCNSPRLLVELFEEHSSKLETVDVLIGDRDEYRSAVDDIALARRLEQLYEAGKLTIRLKNQKTVHAKLYRIVGPDDQVTLIVGSANFSYNSWTNQTNTLAVYTTTKGSQFDQQFKTWLTDLREQYSDKVFMSDLADRLSTMEDPDEKDRYIELWIGNRDTDLSERGEIHTTARAELAELGEQVDRVVGVSDDPEEADEVVTIQPETQSGEQLRETTADDESETKKTDASTAPIKGARTPEYAISLSTAELTDSSYVDQLEQELSLQGANIGNETIRAPVDSYTNYLKRQYDVPKMWIDENREQVHFQHGEHHRILTAGQSPAPDAIDRALANIENYIETVKRWGETNNEEAVMAHMYEGILYALWAPFANLYAETFYGNVTLDNALQYLYIYGESDAGKDQFTEFVLRLLSDDFVRETADADAIGKREIRALREVDTVFPYFISDIAKDKIERIETLRNYWKDSWHPDIEVAYPTLIFTSNDSRPNDWFRNRAKMLHFDVVFPSNPEDEGFYPAQSDLNEILEVRNPIFGYVSRRILQEAYYTTGDGTVNDVRQIFTEFYKQADRPVPSYFPAHEPAPKQYSIGKRKWKSAYERDDIVFEQRENHLIAKFDLETHELYSYRKVLPTKARAEKSGRKIIIKNPSYFKEWIDIEIGTTTSSGFLDGLFNYGG